MTSEFRRTALLLAVLLIATPASAKIYKVRRGETYASIAEEQFGDAALGRLLAFHNGGDPGATPQAKTRIRLPQGRVVRLMVPQRFSDLAIRILNDGSLAPLLARVNGRPEGELLPFLEPVVIPAFLELPRVEGESHAAVARRVYGAGAPAWPVELANAETRDYVRVPVAEFFAPNLTDVKAEAVEKARRRIGRSDRSGKPAATPAPQPTASATPQPAAAEPAVATARPEPVARPEPEQGEPEVARLDPRPNPAAPFPSSTAPRPVETFDSRTPPSAAAPQPAAEPDEPEAAAPPPPTPSATLHRAGPAIPEPLPWAPLESVRQSYERGEYHRAEVGARSLVQSGKVPEELRATAWLLLGLSELARGSEERAVASFQRARAGDPSLDLDPFFYPPKVREAFQQAATGR